MRRSAILAALLVSTACATGGDLQTMQADLNEARRIAHENRNALRTMRDEMAIADTGSTDEDRSTSVVGDEVVSSVRQSQAELGVRIEELVREIRTIQGQVDEIEYRMDQAVRTLNDQKELALIRISALEERVRLLSPTVTPLGTPPGTVTPPPVVPPAPAIMTPPPVVPVVPPKADLDAEDSESPLSIYSRGREHYKSREFAKARETFKAFLDRFPNHEYAGNAQFWVGETFYSQNDYENAILAYEDVLRKYKNSEKVAGAMLKQGYAFAAIGDEKTARIILDRVEKKFPDTREAKLAAGKLKSLRKSRN